MQKAEGWPGAVSLDVSSGIASPVLDDVLRSWASTPVLLLAVGPLAQRGGWAADAAVALAESIASAGQRVVVADLSLDRPELHERLGADNVEGLTDVFLFGASMEHVTKMLPAHSFELIPAAPFTPDTEEILTHRRWGVVFEDLAATKTRLLLYLPVTVDGTGAFSDRVGHTVVLADRGEIETVRDALSGDAEVLAFFAPPEPPPADVATAVEPDIATSAAPDAPAAAPRMADRDFDKIRIPKDGAREALIADLRSRQRAALQAPAPTMTPLPVEVDIPRERVAPPVRSGLGFPPPKASITEPGFTSTVRSEKPRRRVLLPALLVSLLVSTAGASWHYWRGGTIAGLPARNRAANASPVRRPGGPAPTPGEPSLPAGRPLPYSVAIAGYQLLDEAQERVDRLRTDQSSMQFYIAPTVVQGQLYYRVLAGPLPDSATAAAVRDTLMARRIKTMSLGSDLLAAPYAFLIGSFSRRNEAQAKTAEAAAKGIPTYIVPIGAAGGATLYQVYAGAYSGQGDAEFLRDILKSAALPDTLVERTGSIRS